MTADTVATARHSPDLLLVGALTGPAFFVSVVAQTLSRDGFDITRHAISQLANGDLGWVQVVTFALAGLGTLALASGVRTALAEGVGRRSLPVLIGLFGMGLIVAGLFTTDPENGFPPGTTPGTATRMSWHGLVHSTAAAVAFTALAAAAGVLALRCARNRAPATAGLGGLVTLILMLPVPAEHMSIQIAVNGVIAFSWTTALALWLRRSVRTAHR